MIEFEKSTIKDEQYIPDSFTVKVVGQKDEYLDTIKALVGVLGNIDNDSFPLKDRYLICNLIEYMLPDSAQIVSMEEVAELQRIKVQNIEKVKEITD